MVSCCAKPGAKSARLRSHMDWRSDRRTSAALGAGLLVGAATFCMSLLTLGWAALEAGIIKLVFFGPEPPESPWVDLAIIAGSIVMASLVARLIFRVLRSRPLAH